MSFDNMPPQPPLYPQEAEEYAAKAIELSRAAAARIETTWDVPYGEDERQRLDVHVSSRVRPQGAPVLVLLHGGAWTNGYKEWMALAAPSFTELPAVVVSVSYRLGPEHRFPEPLDDVLRALAWVQRNIAAHGGDPERLYLAGHSAGGHLVTLAALRTDLHERFGVRTSGLRHCLPVSAQLNLVFEHAPPGSGEARIRTVFLRDDVDASEASPIHQVGATSVPLLLAYGEKDWPRIATSNRQMAVAAEQAGVLTDVIEIEGFDHFDMHLDMIRPDNPWVRRVAALMAG